MVLGIWFLNSCSKEEAFIPIKQEGLEIVNLGNGQIPVSPQFSNTQNSTTLHTTLGSPRNNPFSLANINQARLNLYGSSMAPKNLTHKYIKFSPNTQEHLADLEKWETSNDIAVFDFPIHYEVVQMGEYYIDPSVSDSLYTYQYASVPSGVGLPNVPNQMLDELYLDKSNPLLIAESFRLTGNTLEIQPYIMNSEGILFNNLPNEVQTTVTPPQDFNCPEGCFIVLGIDDTTVPVQWTFECDCDPDPEQGGDGPPPAQLNDCGCPIPSSVRESHLGVYRFKMTLQMKVSKLLRLK